MSRRRVLCTTLPVLALLVGAPLTAGTVVGTVPCAARCADYVVYLEGVGGSYSGAGEVVELGQKNKIFIPHVLALLAGSTLRIGNDDPFMHNVHARKGDRTLFNLNVLFQYQEVDQVIAEPGIYRVSCEPHPEMSAVLVVLDNPFFSQPDRSGRFGIEGIPPGHYRLVSLDAERERRKSRAVTIAGGVVELEF